MTYHSHVHHLNMLQWSMHAVILALVWLKQPILWMVGGLPLQGQQWIHQAQKLQWHLLHLHQLKICSAPKVIEWRKTCPIIFQLSKIKEILQPSLKLHLTLTAPLFSIGTIPPGNQSGIPFAHDQYEPCKTMRIVLANSGMARAKVDFGAESYANAEVLVNAGRLVFHKINSDARSLLQKRQGPRALSRSVPEAKSVWEFFL